jgi:four helix bundle protein
MNKIPEIIARYYEFLKWLMQRTSKFPRNQRYIFGRRIEENALAVLEKLIEAYYRKEKIELLHQINIELEKSRYLFRLAKDLDLLTIKQYEYAVSQLAEIGMQLGGWIRQQKAR